MRSFLTSEFVVFRELFQQKQCSGVIIRQPLENNVMLSGLMGVVASMSTEEFLEQQKKDFVVYRK